MILLGGVPLAGDPRLLDWSVMSLLASLPVNGSNMASHRTVSATSYCFISLDSEVPDYLADLLSAAFHNSTVRRLRELTEA